MDTQIHSYVEFEYLLVREMAFMLSCAFGYELTHIVPCGLVT